MTCPAHPACGGPAVCMDCLDSKPPERTNPVPVVARAISRPFHARFPADCAGCGLAIHQGQSIVRLDDETYRHQICME